MNEADHLTRYELAKLLDELDEAIKGFNDRYADPAPFWPDFAGIADMVLGSASAADFDWVNQRTSAILAKYALATPPQVP